MPGPFAWFYLALRAWADVEGGYDCGAALQAAVVFMDLNDTQATIYMFWTVHTYVWVRVWCVVFETSCTLPHFASSYPQLVFCSCRFQVCVPPAVQNDLRLEVLTRGPDGWFHDIVLFDSMELGRCVACQWSLPVARATVC